MKSNYRSGFTLVELLAVIVILAVLILLALPTVLRIMDTAKKNSLKTEGLSLINAAETKYAAEGALGIDTDTECIEYKEGTNGNGLKNYMEYKSGYTAIIKKTGDSFTINISDGTFKIVGLTKANQKEVEITEGTLATGESTCD